MKFSWRSEWPHLVLLAGMFALAAASWSTAPDRIPVHWGLRGGPDRFGGRFEGLLAIPLLTAGLYLLMLFLPRIDPGRANYAAFSHAYATFRLALVVLMATLYGAIHLWLHGHPVAVETLAPLAIGAFFIVLGNLLGKVRPNWFIGIRTPWTLSSKLAWTRTHRAGGWVFVAIGVLMMATGLVRTEWAVWVMAVAGGGSVLGLVVYSYVLWRRDPEKTPPAGTLPAGDA
jgi:uncharacterized membrane protein